MQRKGIRGGGVTALLVIGLLGGCGTSANGPERGAISGRVTLDGVVVEQGSIAFIPANGTKGPSSGAAIANGTFAIPLDKGPVVGTNRVEVHWPRKTGRQKEAGSPMPPGTMIDEVAEAIPSEFNSKSTLVQRIEAGENAVEIELESKPTATLQTQR